MADQAFPRGWHCVRAEQIPEQALELSFDLYERYSVLGRLCKGVFPATEGLQVLDVGANSPFFGLAFHP